MDLQALFYPRGVAVSGSVSAGKLGAVLIGRLQEGGYAGNIYAVNPKGQSCGTVAGFRSLQEVDGPLDLVILASPAATVAQVLEDAGQKGVKAAVVISSGFSEAGHPELEEELKQVAARYGIRYIGPNCAGMANTDHNLLATLEAAPAKGNVSLISQSGAVGGMVMSRSQAEGLGIRKFISYGNGSDLSEIELLNYLKDDPGTKVIAMYLENVRQGREFMAALKAATHVKPVVIVKSGRTSSGQRAALSHTGSLAGADQVYDAAFASCGAIRADSIDDLLTLCKGFAMLPPMQGKRLAIVTNSGGPGVMCADLCDQLGLDVAEPSSALKSELQSFLPPHAGLANPIDITVEGGPEQYARSTAAALREYNAAAVIYIGTPYLAALPIVEQVLAEAQKSGKPVAGYFEVGSDIAEAHAYIQAQGQPLFSSAEQAARVLNQLARYQAYLNQPAAEVTVPAGEDLASELPSLLEPQAMALLHKHGIHTPDVRFATSEAEAIAASQAIGYPVVMKVVSPQILHKSDVGGVKLKLADDAAAARAFRELEAIAAAKDFRGVIISPQLRPGREVIFGFTRDPQFGPVVAFGLGGIYTEVLKDVALAIAPLDEAGALKLIQSIRTYPLLAGVRGEKPADLQTLAKMLARFSELPFHYPNLQEADLNPVFVYEDGAVVVDARFILS